MTNHAPGMSTHSVYDISTDIMNICLNKDLYCLCCVCIARCMRGLEGVWNINNDIIAMNVVTFILHTYSHTHTGKST